jgi:hypothetical protein
MERDNHDRTEALIELGSVSADTKGDGGIYWEIGGLQPQPGISAD